MFTTLLDACNTVSLSPAIFAPAPRSYWASTNRTPTQRGILTDYLHAINYATQRWPGTPLVLYGHSLGGAIATCLLGALDDVDGPLDLKSLTSRTRDNCAPAIQGLVLENPFASIPDMVRELYPQRWLPYRFLAPLAWDKWDALGALRKCKQGSVLQKISRNALVVVSEKDEVVPKTMGEAMFREMAMNELEVEALSSGPATSTTSTEPPGSVAKPKLLIIKDALHENAWMQRQWAVGVARYLNRFRRNSSS